MTKAITASTTYNALASGNQPASLLDASFAQFINAFADPTAFSNYVADTGVVNAYACTPAPAWTTYTGNPIISVKIANTNTGASTLNVSGLGAIAIKHPDGTSLNAGDLRSGGIYIFIHDGTNFQLQTTALSGTATNALNFAATVTLASAGTVNIGAAASNDIIISGGTTITAFDTIAAGAYRWVEFSGALTLTNNASSLILPGGANITTAAGDTALFVSLGAGNWRCVSYQKASGFAVVASPAAIVLLATLTPTVATNVDALTVFTSSYDNYLIIGENIQPGTNGILAMQFAKAGVVDAGSNYFALTGAANNGTNGTATTNLLLTQANMVTTGGTSQIGINFTITVKNANSTNLKSIFSEAVYLSAVTPTFRQDYGGGVYAISGTTTISGVRFLWNAGNNFAATGTIRIYGLQNS